MKQDDVKKVVRDNYAEIAKEALALDDKESVACCGNETDSKDVNQIGEMLGYASSELITIPDGANLGLGCGNPLALGEISEGDRVLDLGSGAGFDAFLAARKCGESGQVIGVDFTPEMIEKAKLNAEKSGISNVQFLLGDIEDLPEDIANDSIDLVISNCVINLAPNKEKVFREAHRVLKAGGKLFVSDIVLLEELSEAQREDEELIACCVGGAILRDAYIETMLSAGFKVERMAENPEVSKQQYQGLPVESLSVVAIK